MEKMNLTPQNIAEVITGEIIKELEQHQQNGTLPSWIKPWTAEGGSADRPYNPVTKNHYNGINWLWLSCLQASGEYGSSNEWLTYKQAQKITGEKFPIKKGSRSVQVVYFSPIRKEKEVTNSDGSVETKVENFRLMKIYRVFNRDMVKGLEPQAVNPIESTPKNKIYENVEQFFGKTKAELTIGGDQAFFNPSRDYIQMPELQAFKTSEDYYSTLLHELTHWTGHKSRLDRLEISNQKGYAFEELVAELGSAMLNKKLGIEGKLQHVEYIGSWIKVLKDDNKNILKASALAQKAVDYLEELTDTKTNKYEETEETEGAEV